MAQGKIHYSRVLDVLLSFIYELRKLRDRDAAELSPRKRGDQCVRTATASSCAPHIRRQRLRALACIREASIVPILAVRPHRLGLLILRRPGLIPTMLLYDMIYFTTSTASARDAGVAPCSLKNRWSAISYFRAAFPVAVVMRMNAASTSSTHSDRVHGLCRSEGTDSARMPMPVFRISMTASLALRPSRNRAVATAVGTSGVRRMVTFVIMPSVPSAPIYNFVMSNPAADLRARRRVLITSPDGRTTVYRKFSVRTGPTDNTGAHRVQEPLALRCTVPHRIGYGKVNSL